MAAAFPFLLCRPQPVALLLCAVCACGAPEATPARVPTVVRPLPAVTIEPVQNVPSLGPHSTPVAETVATEPPPAWSWLFAQYFAAGTAGACGRASACHAANMETPASAYEWLEQRGYIAGKQSPLVSATNSCLRWFGGNMPPKGQPNAEAAHDLTAWVAAGALED
jgi:hypothetical protein